MSSKLDQLSRPPQDRLGKLHIIVNPVSGDRTASDYFKTELKPFLSKHDIHYALHTTQSAESATEYAASLDYSHLITLMILSGDGTLHEFFQGLPIQPAIPNINLILLPFGTANALYHSLFSSSSSSRAASRLHSLIQALQLKTNPKPLPLLQVSVNNKTFLSHVVVSTALHASILFDSDKLRSDIPGLERFKKAAEMNWGSEYAGVVSLKGRVERYIPLRGFVVEEVEEELKGPWAYLNVCLVDRLEETFIVAPKRAEAPAGTVDVVAIQRPRGADSKAFFEGLVEVFGAMYDGGLHVDLIWEGGQLRAWKDGDSVDQLVVAYWRCYGLTWKPVRSSTKWHYCRLSICM